MGMYDTDKFKTLITYGVGRDGETYTVIGRYPLNLPHFPILVDQEVPFGSPISDSMRTRVTNESARILWITFTPPHTAIPQPEFADTMMRFNGGTLRSSIEL